ncbi:MAG TPA: hypothetical protein VLM11_12960 [Streptosporangiaceae bacterium]|nr:hypothetical protein [Streptosporangiaceae bacterium]
MIRHASAEDLAGLDLDALKPRKAARIRSHVASCVQCTQLSSQVSAVVVVLASVPYPSMPASLTTELDATLASESARRLASAPATEAGRRDLPERRARKQRERGQLPRMSVLATRLVAAAGALILVGVGGYEIATQTGGNATGTAASSGGSAAAPAVRNLGLGPVVPYQGKTFQTVHSNTNFTRADLGAQATAAVHAAELKGVAGAHAAGAPAPTGDRTFGSGTASQGQASKASLASCLGAVVGSRPVELVETAKFEGQPATIIVTQQTATHPAEVWAVSLACSAAHPDLLDHQTLSRT